MYVDEIKRWGLHSRVIHQSSCWCPVRICFRHNIMWFRCWSTEMHAFGISFIVVTLTCTSCAKHLCLWISPVCDNTARPCKTPNYDCVSLPTAHIDCWNAHTARHEQKQKVWTPARLPECPHRLYCQALWGRHLCCPAAELPVWTSWQACQAQHCWFTSPKCAMLCCAMLSCAIMHDWCKHEKHSCSLRMGKPVSPFRVWLGKTGRCCEVLNTVLSCHCSIDVLFCCTVQDCWSSQIILNLPVQGSNMQRPADQ